MSYTLQDFCAEIHEILVAENNADGREKVRQKLEQLLENETFIEQFCGPDKPAGVYKLNEDPTTGRSFCPCDGRGRDVAAHDHGASWAIYGQATEHTVMREWYRTDEGPMTRISRLRKIGIPADPGQVGLFNPGVIHSIEYPDNARFVRVTGVDLDRSTARPIT